MGNDGIIARPLKFKGGGGAKKKKKNKSNIHKEAIEREDASTSKDIDHGNEGKVEEMEGQEQEDQVSAESNSKRVVIGKTKAEARFDEVRRKRLADKAKKQAVKSHKERVAEFNEKLSNLSEHYDIPRVGPG